MYFYVSESIIVKPIPFRSIPTDTYTIPEPQNP